jgi:hypothetical protein
VKPCVWAPQCLSSRRAACTRPRPLPTLSPPSPHPLPTLPPPSPHPPPTLRAPSNPPTRRLLVKQLNKKEAGLYKSMFKALGKGASKDEEQPKADQAAAGEPMEADGGAAAAAAPPPAAPEAVAV